ncbi:MAG: SGNH/GDSL hydrolase family protein [Pirellulales bacterium]
MRALKWSSILFVLGWLSLAVSTSSVQAEAPPLKLAKGNHVVLIGNTLAERMQYYGNFETQLHSRFPDLELVVRDLGWSADEVNLRPRSQDFKDHGHNLEDHKADVILAFFGFNESFGGEKGLPKFRGDLENFVKTTKAAKYNGTSAPQLVLFSPIAHENLGKRELPDGSASNKNIELYSAAMKEIAAKHDVLFVDIYTPTHKAMAEAKQKWTINGIHLNNHGDAELAKILDTSLFGARPAGSEKVNLQKLLAEVQEKNLQFFYDYRAVNGFYIYGGRKNPFGTVNFPAEFAKLRKMIANRDSRIWAVAQGKRSSNQN